MSHAAFQDLSGVSPAFSHLLFERTEYFGLTAGLTKDFESVGLSEAQARTDLANLGFQVQILQQVVNEQIGSVLAQAPKPGTKSSEGALITITVGVQPGTTIVIPPPPTPTPTPTVTVTTSPSPSSTATP